MFCDEKLIIKNAVRIVYGVYGVIISNENINYKNMRKGW